MNTILEADLKRLRDVVARLYGEDIAQDTMVRVLSREYRDEWFAKEVWYAKRQWQRQEATALKHEPMVESNEPRIIEADRIDARIEIERRLARPGFLTLLREAIGLGAALEPWERQKLRRRERNG